MSILVVDDDPGYCEGLSLHLEHSGYATLVAYSAAEGLRKASSAHPRCVLLDWNLPDACGRDMIPQLRQACGSVPIIMISADPDVHNAVSAVKAGADNYLCKPLNLRELDLMLERFQAGDGPALFPHGANGRLQLRLPSPAMQDIYQQAERIAPFRDMSVLIHGETGVGKEHIVQLIHERSCLSGGTLVEVNCGAIPESLFESEIFGHEPGAFTDAKKRRIGALEAAGAGTVFLDEVGELALPLQAKLLKIIEEKALRRLGGDRDIRVEARIVAATNRDLRSEVAARRFREDLFYRISNYSIHVPPLRERREDCLALARFFFKQASMERDPPSPDPIPEGLLETVASYAWPGNIRELKNFIFKLVIDGPQDAYPQMLLPLESAGDVFFTGPSNAREAKRRLYREVLERHQGNLSRAAKELGITRQTLAKWTVSVKKENP